jgi:hypothetical protein
MRTEDRMRIKSRLRVEAGEQRDGDEQLIETGACLALQSVAGKQHHRWQRRCRVSDAPGARAYTENVSVEFYGDSG